MDLRTCFGSASVSKLRDESRQLDDLIDYLKYR